jgi:hypothetical protein
MNKPNENGLEKEIEKKLIKKEKRGRKRMPVSGAGVKKLQKIIIAK